MSMKRTTKDEDGNTNDLASLAIAVGVGNDARGRCLDYFVEIAA